MSSLRSSGVRPKRWRVGSAPVRSQRRCVVMASLAIRRARQAQSTDTLLFRIHFTNTLESRSSTGSSSAAGRAAANSQTNSPRQQPMVQVSSRAKTVASTGCSLQLFCSMMGRHSLLVQKAQWTLGSLNSTGSMSVRSPFAVQTCATSLYPYRSLKKRMPEHCDSRASRLNDTISALASSKRFRDVIFSEVRFRSRPRIVQKRFSSNSISAKSPCSSMRSKTARMGQAGLGRRKAPEMGLSMKRSRMVSWSSLRECCAGTEGASLVSACLACRQTMPCSLRSSYSQMLRVAMCITSFSTGMRALTGTHPQLKTDSSSTRQRTRTLLLRTSMKTMRANRCSCPPQPSSGVPNSPRLGTFTSTFSPTNTSSSSSEFQLWLESGMTAPAGSLLSQMMQATRLASVWSPTLSGRRICSQKSSISICLRVVLTNSQILGRMFFSQYLRSLFCSIWGGCEGSRYLLLTGECVSAPSCRTSLLEFSFSRRSGTRNSSTSPSSYSSDKQFPNRCNCPCSLSTSFSSSFCTSDSQSRSYLNEFRPAVKRNSFSVNCCEAAFPTKDNSHRFSFRKQKVSSRNSLTSALLATLTLPRSRMRSIFSISYSGKSVSSCSGRPPRGAVRTFSQGVVCSVSAASFAGTRMLSRRPLSTPPCARKKVVPGQSLRKTRSVFLRMREMPLSTHCLPNSTAGWSAGSSRAGNSSKGRKARESGRASSRRARRAAAAGSLRPPSCAWNPSSCSKQAQFLALMSVILTFDVNAGVTSLRSRRPRSSPFLSSSGTSLSLPAAPAVRSWQIWFMRVRGTSSRKRQQPLREKPSMSWLISRRQPRMRDWKFLARTNSALTSSPSPSFGSSIGFPFSYSYFFMNFPSKAQLHGFLALGLLPAFLLGRFCALGFGRLGCLRGEDGCGRSRGSAKTLQQLRNQPTGRVASRAASTALTLGKLRKMRSLRSRSFAGFSFSFSSCCCCCCCCCSRLPSSRFLPFCARQSAKSLSCGRVFSLWRSSSSSTQQSTLTSQYRSSSWCRLRMILKRSSSRPLPTAPPSKRRSSSLCWLSSNTPWILESSSSTLLPQGEGERRKVSRELSWWRSERAQRVYSQSRGVRIPSFRLIFSFRRIFSDILATMGTSMWQRMKKSSSATRTFSSAVMRFRQSPSSFFSKKRARSTKKRSFQRLKHTLLRPTSFSRRARTVLVSCCPTSARWTSMEARQVISSLWLERCLKGMRKSATYRLMSGFSLSSRKSECSRGRSTSRNSCSLLFSRPSSFSRRSGSRSTSTPSAAFRLVLNWPYTSSRSLILAWAMEERDERQWWWRLRVSVPRAYLSSGEAASARRRRLFCAQKSVRLAHWWWRVAMAASIAGSSIHALMYFTISSTGNLSSTRPSFLNPFHFFQFYSHSRNRLSLFASTLRLSELSDRPMLTGTMSSLDSRDSRVLGERNLRRKRQEGMRWSMGCVQTLSGDSTGFSEAFTTSSMMRLTFSNWLASSYLILRTWQMPFTSASLLESRSLAMRSNSALSMVRSTAFSSTFSRLGAGFSSPIFMDLTVLPLRLREMLTLGFFSSGSSGFTSSCASRPRQVSSRSRHSLTFWMRAMNAQQMPSRASSKALRFSLMYSMLNLRLRWRSPECLRMVRKRMDSPCSQNCLCLLSKVLRRIMCAYDPFSFANCRAYENTSMKSPRNAWICSRQPRMQLGMPQKFHSSSPTATVAPFPTGLQLFSCVRWRMSWSCEGSSCLSMKAETTSTGAGADASKRAAFSSKPYLNTLFLSSSAILGSVCQFSRCRQFSMVLESATTVLFSVFRQVSKFTSPWNIFSAFSRLPAANLGRPPKIGLSANLKPQRTRLCVSLTCPELLKSTERALARMRQGFLVSTDPERRRALLKTPSLIWMLLPTAPSSCSIWRLSVSLLGSDWQRLSRSTSTAVACGKLRGGKLQFLPRSSGWAVSQTFSVEGDTPSSSPSSSSDSASLNSGFCMCSSARSSEPTISWLGDRGTTDPWYNCTTNRKVGRMQCNCSARLRASTRSYSLKDSANRSCSSLRQVAESLVLEEISLKAERKSSSMKRLPVGEARTRCCRYSNSCLRRGSS